MLVAIPSKGRAGSVKSLATLGVATLYVPENEAEDYRLFYPDVVAVPGEVKGITETRNWILRNTDDEWVVFIDDDVRVAGWIELGWTRGFHHGLSPGAWHREFVRLFEVTEQMDYSIWGVATCSSLRSWYPWRPFIWHTYVTASCMGIRNRGLYFDETFPVKEDYELCLRCIKNDGGVVGARYLYWENEHWDTAGGCKDYRTRAVEERMTSRLMTMYPGMIRRVTRRGTDFAIELEF